MRSFLLARTVIITIIIVVVVFVSRRVVPTPTAELQRAAERSPAAGARGKVDSTSGI